MRERKRDYAGACGQYLYTQFYAARQNPSTGKKPFLEKFFAGASGRIWRPPPRDAIHAKGESRRAHFTFVGTLVEKVRRHFDRGGPQFCHFDRIAASHSCHLDPSAASHLCHFDRSAAEWRNPVASGLLLRSRPVSSLSLLLTGFDGSLAVYGAHASVAGRFLRSGLRPPVEMTGGPKRAAVGMAKGRKRAPVEMTATALAQGKVPANLNRTQNAEAGVGSLDARAAVPYSAPLNEMSHGQGNENAEVKSM